MTRADGTKPVGVCYEECGPFPTASKAVRDYYLWLFEYWRPTKMFTIDNKDLIVYGT